MSNYETNWDSEDAMSEELTDDELAAIQGGTNDFNFGALIDNTTQVAVVAGNLINGSVTIGQFH